MHLEFLNHRYRRKEKRLNIKLYRTLQLSEGTAEGKSMEETMRIHEEFKRVRVHGEDSCFHLWLLTIRTSPIYTKLKGNHR